MLRRLLEYLDRFIAHDTRSDLDLYHRARMFVGIALFMALMSPFYAVLHFVAGTNVHAWVALVEGAGFMLAVWFFRRTQRLAPAVHLFDAILFALLVQKAWLAGGFTLAGAASLTWLWACPILATVLLGTRSGMVWTLPTVGTYTFLFGLTAFSRDLPSTISVESAPAVFYGDMLGFGFALLVLSALFSYGKRQVLEAEQQRAWLASFPELSPELVAEISEAGDVTYLNPAIKALFPDLERRGSSHPFLHQLNESELVLINASQVAAVREVHVEARAYEQRISRAPGGSLRIYANDVTDRLRYEAGLREARERAEEMVRLKEAFVAKMSHEIRTPLVGILGGATLLADEIAGEHHEFVSMILKSGKRLETMLESILELARLEANDVDLKPESVDLNREIDDVVQRFQSRAKEKEIELKSLKASVNGEAIVRTDRDALRQILAHLVDNAVKFTHAGAVTVAMQPGEGGVHIYVEDTGIGMDSSFLPELYAPFRQASEGLSRNYEGSGLGLTIVRRLVELLDAEMSVESAIGEGTTVTLFLRRSIPSRHLRQKASEQ